MWYQGNIYIADEYDDQMKMVEDFCENDAYNSMLIIDPHLMIERYKEMRDTLNYNISITWFNTIYVPNPNEKNIFINEVFDTVAQDWVTKNYSIVAFF
jgi:hypothetical protein